MDLKEIFQFQISLSQTIENCAMSLPRMMSRQITSCHFPPLRIWHQRTHFYHDLAKKLVFFRYSKTLLKFRNGLAFRNSQDIKGSKNEDQNTIFCNPAIRLTRFPVGVGGYGPRGLPNPSCFIISVTEANVGFNCQKKKVGRGKCLCNSIVFNFL